MRDIVILFLHLMVTWMQLARPGSIRSVVAEYVLVKHQALLLNRSRTAHRTYVRRSDYCRLIGAFDASRPRCPFCNRAIRLGVAAELPSRLRWPSAFRLIRMS